MTWSISKITLPLYKGYPLPVVPQLRGIGYCTGMIKHIVMWRYKNKNDIETARKALDSMKGRVPSMLSIETGENFRKSPASYDLVLITEHEDPAALDAYQEDPVHGEVKIVLGKLKSEMAAVDFQSGDGTETAV